MSINPFDFPKRIVNFLKINPSNTTILVTIRNHQTKIPAGYVQSLKFYYNDVKNKTLQKHINFIFSNKEYFSSYYYDKLFAAWADTFGKENIKVLFYEDFLYDKDTFFNELSKLLKIPEEILKCTLEDKHFNKKDKKKDYVVKQIKSDNVLKNMIYQFFLISIIKKIYSPFKKIFPNNVFLQIYKKLRDKKLIIKNLNDIQKRRIFNEFKSSNEKLHTEFGVSLEKLKKYGYID